VASSISLVLIVIIYSLYFFSISSSQRLNARDRAEHRIQALFSRMGREIEEAKRVVAPVQGGKGNKLIIINRDGLLVMFHLSKEDSASEGLLSLERSLLGEPGIQAYERDEYSNFLGRNSPFSYPFIKEFRVSTASSNSGKSAGLVTLLISTYIQDQRVKGIDPLRSPYLTYINAFRLLGNEYDWIPTL